MKQKKKNTVEERFSKSGLIVKRLTTTEDLKTNSWVMPTSDKKGMIKIKTKIKY